MTHNQNLVVLRAFGNDLDALVNDTVLPLAMSRLRGQLTMPKLITVDTADEAKQVGETVRVQKPIKFSQADEHGVDGSTASDLVAEKVDLKLNRHIYKEFKMSDREFTGSMGGSIPSALEGAVDVIAEAVNAAIFAMVQEVSAYSGVLDSQNGRTKDDLISAKTKLDQAKVSKSGRNLVLSSESEGELLKVFTAGNDQSAEKEGFIGRRFGFDTYSDIQCDYHVAGTASADANIVTAINVAAGSKILVLEGATAGATVVKGDVITIAGQSFAVAEATVFADGSAAVSVENAVETAIASGTAAQVAGTHRGDVAFTKDAFVIAFRQLENPTEVPGVTVGSMTDPVTGITLRLMSWYNPSTENTHWKLETLFGVKAVAPERAIRLGGH
ncbi:hypothetical protein N7335_01970 [Stutzerimonas stutzeri]|uniref:P22 coat-protein 5 family protein n=1 Tax=Stutzerimonas stutzeri TaxID=316 RepID=A0AA42KV20_STUST|nr:P22 phage major capsid protein family protein [Stutzerimonas stutzeri]MDH0145153.1 hypothetical protein [Stutzerimonas stutzeri]MDH0149592.1 hypothetical protein [Stutzerimonas stutzeri]